MLSRSLAVRCPCGESNVLACQLHLLPSPTVQSDQKIPDRATVSKFPLVAVRGSVRVGEPKVPGGFEAVLLVKPLRRTSVAQDIHIITF